MVLKISGCYEECHSTSFQGRAKKPQLELRIDVDDDGSMNVVSGDLYSISGKIRTYLNSFIFTNIKKNVRENGVTLIGESGKFDSKSEILSHLKIIIPLNSSRVIANVSWINNSGVESRCQCEYKSKYFRTVGLQNDYEEGIAPFKSYDRRVLVPPSGNSSDPITVRSAYADAGIKIVRIKGSPKHIPHPEHIPRRGLIWTDDALNRTMVKYFKTDKGKPQWKIWLFSASEYEVPDVRGIMLSYKEKQRVGCAVFHRAIGGESNEQKRMLLHVYVHELGHCFNLQHPWIKTRRKEYTSKEGHSSLSWMNCPERFYSSVNCYGEDAFWRNFQFRFSDEELLHLRHGFRNDVIFGGNNFTESRKADFLEQASKGKR